jgi:fructokinase
MNPEATAVIVGTGRLTLDVILRPGLPARSQAGGTCGNVLTNLAWLGWSAYPLTDIGDDVTGRAFLTDLARFGVHLNLIRQYPTEETPVILHHITKTDKGTQHSFSSKCPFCGQRLRYYEPLPLEHVQERLSAIPRANVCFFDRDSPSAFLVARQCRSQGALIVFEPNYAGSETNFAEAVTLADVVKYSRERLAGLETRAEMNGPALLIETLGADGLRFRLRGGNWRESPAMPIATVRDAGGSGDWCTAGFLHAFQGRNLHEVTEDQVMQALRFGQALGAWNCAFEGARGGVYCAGRERILDDVRRLLEGEFFDPAESTHASTQDIAACWCRGCFVE